MTATNNSKNNNYSELIIPENHENIDGDKTATIGRQSAENVATKTTFDSEGASDDIAQDRKDKVDPLIPLFIILFLIGLILLIKWINDKWKLPKNGD